MIEHPVATAKQLRKRLKIARILTKHSRAELGTAAELLQLLPIVQVISNLTGGAWPARIAVTGYAQGGGLAKLAATWAGAAYPGSHIRLIVFGAPRVGDERCVANH